MKPIFTIILAFNFIVIPGKIQYQRSVWNNLEVCYTPEFDSKLLQDSLKVFLDESADIVEQIREDQKVIKDNRGYEYNLRKKWKQVK